MSKLASNWEQLKKQNPNLVGTQKSLFKIRCDKCEQVFLSARIDFVLCKDCAARVSPKIKGNSFEGDFAKIDASQKEKMLGETKGEEYNSSPIIIKGGVSNGD